ncbi:hypothetical protein SAY86_013393 [Trapa natans]|uniref:EF-hand domain-containing protein n=1 Tax=Trapa natans TaxID=22666 RepID=A0AAN7LZJ3_TRANT|nr:hypothetical protein SAY86_013393 [Trapa natans]
MSSFRQLDLQYSLSKRKILRKTSRFLSFSQSRQNSGLSGVYQPNMEELRKVFDRFDANRDGKISQQEYKAILRALGKEAAIEEVPHIFRIADLDGDGFIDFREFVEAHMHGGGIRVREIQSAFSTFDLNGDGKITAEEVLKVLRSLGERCNLEDCRRMVRAVDRDGDGAVNLDEFMDMMTQTLKS